MLESSDGYTDAKASGSRREDDGSKYRHWSISSVAGKSVGVSRVVSSIVDCVDMRKACEPDDKDAKDNGKESLNCGTSRDGGGLRDGFLLQHISHPELLTSLD